MSRRRAGSFSLLEIVVALGVLGIGATAAFALLVAAAAAGRRAEHATNAALLAETAINELAGTPFSVLDLDDLPRAGDAPTLDPTQPPPNPETRLLLDDHERPGYPDYRYDLAVTPLPGSDPGDPWRFLVEVHVRWAERGQSRGGRFETILLKQTGVPQANGP